MISPSRLDSINYRNWKNAPEETVIVCVTVLLTPPGLEVVKLTINIPEDAYE